MRKLATSPGEGVSDEFVVAGDTFDHEGGAKLGLPR